MDGRASAARRVALIAYHASPLLEPGEGDAGGMSVYVRDVAKWLVRRGVATDIFTRATGDGDRIVGIAPGVRVISIPAGPRTCLDKDELVGYMDEFVSGVRAFAMAQRARYDLVHSHYWQSGLAAQALTQFWGAPFVHSHHTLGRVKNNVLVSGDLPEPQRRLDGETKVIKEADVLIASTDDEWQELACLYGASHDRLKTVHPGVDHSMFSPGDRAAARAELGLAGEAVMLYAGRIQPLKGLKLAISAVGELIDEVDRRLVFLVVGGPSGPQGGQEIEELRALVGELGVRENVRFVGPQPHARLPVFYRAADVAIVCSYSESFGLSALEAQACGTPVVGTAVGGLSHVVRDGLSGWLVKTRDPAAFAAKVKSLLNDEELRARFGAAATVSAAAFSWEQTADELLALYDCLVREQLPEACTC